jgi:hypothetical protein
VKIRGAINDGTSATPDDVVQHITATQYEAARWFHIRAARYLKLRSPRQQLNRRSIVNERIAAGVGLRPMDRDVDVAWLRVVILLQLIT